VSGAKKRAHKLREDERIGQSELKRMGMMGKWIEVGMELGIKVKQTTSSSSSVWWEG
jgi:hypothetical protein